MSHLSEERLFALVDGPIDPRASTAEDDATHLSACAQCRDALEELRGLVSDLAGSRDDEVRESDVRHVMEAIAAREASRAGADAVRPRAPRAWMAAATTALAIAAGVALFVGSRRAPGEGEFIARGGQVASSLAKDVGVRVFAGERRPVVLRDGAVVTPDEALVAGFTNVHAGAAYLVMFAVDSSAQVHWLYPAYEHAGDDPSSVPLERTTHERFMPTSVVLDAPSEGVLRIYAVTTTAPIRVADIEARDPRSLDRTLLERDFHASVTETRVQVRSSR